MRFADVVNQKKFSLVVQMDPPKGTDLTQSFNSALAVRGRVDAILFTNNPMATMRMNPIAPCSLFQQKTMETILTVNSRDRNRLAFQADLLAAWALGIHSLLLREGADPTYGDHPLAVPCNDLNLEGMLEAVASFREGKDLAGQTLDAPPSFHAGVGIDLSDDEKANRQKAAELAELAKRGAQFVVLGTTYDKDTVKLFSEAAAKSGIKVFASILLLKSVGMAKYLNNLAGAPKIPDEMIRKIQKAPIKPKACLEIAAEFMRELETLCNGVVVVPLGWESKIPELLDLFHP